MSVLLAVVLVALGPAASTPAEPPRLTFSPAECEVWARELGFAQSVAEHDHAAFAEHVHAGAVFIPAPNALLRGRAAIAEGWRDTIDGKQLALRWHPQTVAIGGDPDTAVSQGPYWIEDLRPDAPRRFSIGRYNSVWSRGSDGVWHVLFDGGGEPPRPATADDVARLRGSLARECPRSSG